MIEPMHSVLNTSRVSLSISIICACLLALVFTCANKVIAQSATMPDSLKTLLVHPDKSVQAKAFIKMADYYASSHVDTALSYWRKAEERRAEIRSASLDSFLYEVSRRIGHGFRNQGRYDESIEQFELNRTYHERAGNLKKMGEELYNVANSYRDSDRPIEALEAYMTVIEKSEEEGIFSLAAMANISASSIYNDRAPGPRLARKGYEMLEEERGEISPRIRAIGFNNLGAYYLGVENPDSTLLMLEKVLEIEEEYGNPKGNVYMNINFADAHILNEAPDEALRFLEIARSGAANNFSDNPRVQLAVLRAFLRYASIVEDRDMAEMYARQILSFEEKSHVPLRSRWRSYQVLAELERDRGNVEQENLYARTFGELSDQLVIKEEAYKRYLHDKALDYVESDYSNKLLTADIDKRRKLLTWITGCLLLMCLLLLVTMTAHRDKKHHLAELKRKNEALIVATQEAELASRAKSSLLQNMSHEFRTPLNSIIGFADVLLMDQPHASEQHEMLESISQNGHRLKDTLESVLDLAQLESGDFSLETEKLDLNCLVRSTLQDFHEDTQKKGLEFRTQESEKPTFIMGNKAVVGKIISGLVDNAIKFTDSGFVEVVIESAGAEGRVTVRDTGIGISPEHLKNIFVPFMQASTGLNRSHEGAGLTLAVAHGLVKIMGGRLDVETEHQRGSIFTLALPLTKGFTRTFPGAAEGETISPDRSRSQKEQRTLTS